MKIPTPWLRRSKLQQLSNPVRICLYRVGVPCTYETCKCSPEPKEFQARRKGEQK